MEAPVMWHPEFRLALARFVWARSGFIAPEAFWDDNLAKTGIALINTFDAAGIPFLPEDV